MTRGKRRIRGAVSRLWRFGLLAVVAGACGGKANEQQLMKGAQSTPYGYIVRILGHKYMVLQKLVLMRKYIPEAGY